MKKTTKLLTGIALFATITACQNSMSNNLKTTDKKTETKTHNDNDGHHDDEKIDKNFTRAVASNVPSVYSKITYATDIYMTSDSNSVVIKTKGRPENSSRDYYKDTIWESTLYAQDAYTNSVNPDTGSTFKKNPGKIIQYGMVFTIPVNPSSTQNVYTKAPAGPMGVTTNGVSIYSPYNVDGTEATEEAVSFDQYGAHPDGYDKYHYHTIPRDLTTTDTSTSANQTLSRALVGFMLDGFPVYGPKEGNGATPQGLDTTYGGHFGVTPDYPNGIYHYHVGAQNFLSGKPYFNTGYYKGTQGTVTYYPDFNSQDWSNKSLTGINLANGDFKNGNFTNVDFSSCDLTGADFTGATLTNAKLSGATWTNGSSICNTASIGSCTDYEYEPASANLKLALKMNGNTNDSSTNGKNATAVNNPVLSTDRLSKSNKSYTFNGTNYLTVPTIFDSASIPTEVSVEAWVNPSTSADGDNYVFYGGDNAEFTLVTANNSLRFATRIYNTAGTSATWYNAESLTTLPRNSWTHLVGVWKKGVSTKLYINGVLSATTTVPNTNLNDPGTSAISYVGAKSNNGTKQGSLVATVDQVKVYNKALSDTEIATMYNTEK